tara:strand:+ start:223 stop:975 length:753 start_codon:yes stop_codon:yes gene_type:complete
MAKIKLTEEMKADMAENLAASNATVMLEVKSGNKVSTEETAITLDLLKDQIADCAAGEKQVAKATETAKVRNTRVGTTLDTMTKALNCFPLSLINNGSSVTTLLDKNPEYTKAQLEAAMPYFLFFMETCRELKISPQQIKKSSAYYEGAGKTDDAVKRAEELGIVEEGTLEAIKEERASKKDKAKAVRAERIASEEIRDTEPSRWQIGQLNEYITMWRTKEISNASIQANVDSVISILLHAAKELDKLDS